MKKKFCALTCILLLLCNSITVKAKPQDENEYKVNMKRDLLCLMLGYSEYVKGIEKDNSGNVFLVMKSGIKIIYDDKKDKNFNEKLNNPDLQDMMEQQYPLTPVTKLLEKDFDPGRARVYALLRDVYGSSRTAIEKNIITINTAAGSFQFNSHNKAAIELKAIMTELVPIARSNPKVSACLFPTNGTFNYRLIAGTGRLSPHSFGTAIDLSRDKRDYWQWASREEGEKRLLSYPKELVEVFERHNFVWGGKWGHFDILHFEYRPEIILKAKYFSTYSGSGDWYAGISEEDDNIKNYIKFIDETIK